MVHTKAIAKDNLIPPCTQLALDQAEKFDQTETCARHGGRPPTRPQRSITSPGPGFALALAGLRRLGFQRRVVQIKAVQKDDFIEPLVHVYLGPVDPSFGALYGRLKFTVQRHKFNKDSISRAVDPGLGLHMSAGLLQPLFASLSIFSPGAIKKTI